MREKQEDVNYARIAEAIQFIHDNRRLGWEAVRREERW